VPLLFFLLCCSIPRCLRWSVRRPACRICIRHVVITLWASEQFCCLPWSPCLSDLDTTALSNPPLWSMLIPTKTIIYLFSVRSSPPTKSQLVCSGPESRIVFLVSGLGRFWFHAVGNSVTLIEQTGWLPAVAWLCDGPPDSYLCNLDEILVPAVGYLGGQLSAGMTMGGVHVGLIITIKAFNWAHLHNKEYYGA